MITTEFNDTQKKVLTRIETALARTKWSMSKTLASFDMSGMYEPFLVQYNAVASRYIPESELRDEWDKQSRAWCTKPDEKASTDFAGWILAKRRKQSQTADELYSRMTRDHSYHIVSPTSEMVYKRIIRLMSDS